MTQIADGFVRKGETILGRVIEGEFQPFAPIPVGADFDNLVDDVCKAVEGLFDKRLHPYYVESQNQHSSFLMTGRHSSLGWGGSESWIGHDGVESWIRQGTLRGLEDSNPVLNAFLAEKKQAARMRKLSPDWQLDHYDFQLLGSKFGLPAPPTREELERQRREERTRYEEQSRRDAEDDAEYRRQQAVQKKQEDALRPEAVSVVREIEKHEWMNEWGDEKSFIWEYHDDAPDEGGLDDCIRDRIDLVVKLMAMTTPPIPSEDLIAFFKANFRLDRDDVETVDEFSRVAALYVQEFFKAQAQYAKASVAQKTGGENDGTVSEETQ
jgi:hypothetical protein